MKIYDCFLYCNEDIILDVRLNTLNKFVDKFVIVESKYYHNGQYKGFNFKIENYEKFKEKIVYLAINEKPNNLEILEAKKKNISKKIMNAIKFENDQRNYIQNAIINCEDDDIIILSDIDEIPKLDKLNFSKINDEIVHFNQKYCYYKFNLFNPHQSWFGSRLIKKKNLKNPQWLRNLKIKKYPFWRIDKIFNDKIYPNFKLIQNGGWHFSYLNNAEGILNKLQTYLHHVDFENQKLSQQDIAEYIKKRKPVYDLSSDQKKNKLNSNIILEKIDNDELPTYITDNIVKFKDWLI